MKKRNLCLSAVALACAAGAHAQSSVTLWGIVDVNVQQFRGEGVGNVTAVGNGSLSTSQLGFRGSEDLGGGLRANFWLEGSLNPDNGTGRSTNVNNQVVTGPASRPGTDGLLFDRRSYVGLSGGWGEVRLGHDFLPTHYNSISFDPFNANGVARAGNFTFSAAGNGSLPTTITASNSISYWLPRDLGGFYGLAMYALGENPSGAANEDDGNLFAARVGWTNGKFDVAVAAQRTSFTAGPAVGDLAHANIGASYAFPWAKFFALYNQVEVDVAAGTVRKRAFEVGAHVPVTPIARIRVSYARLEDRSTSGLVNANGSARSENDASQFGVGFVYDLSKRTALYGTYARISNEGQGTYAVTGGLAPVAGGYSSGLEMGVRHTF